MQGYTKIEALEGYTGVKVLWLEGNGLSVIEGLNNQPELRTLYLQENLIERLENLEHVVGPEQYPATTMYNRPLIAKASHLKLESKFDFARGKSRTVH